MVERRACSVALPASCPTAQPGHFRRGAGLVDEHQPVRLLPHPRLATATPRPACQGHALATDLVGHQRFCDGIAGRSPEPRPRCRRRHRPSSLTNRAADLGIVMSPCLSSQRIRTPHAPPACPHQPDDVVAPGPEGLSPPSAAPAVRPCSRWSRDAVPLHAASRHRQSRHKPAPEDRQNAPCPRSTSADGGSQIRPRVNPAIHTQARRSKPAVRAHDGSLAP